MKSRIMGLVAVGLPALLLTQPALAVTSQCDGVSGNLVLNCGFETPRTVTPWTTGGTNGVAFSLEFIERTGSRAALLNFDSGGSASISQTVGGAGTYDVSFWLGLYDAGVPNRPAPTISAWFGGQNLSIALPPTNGGQQTFVYGFYSFSNLLVSGPATLMFETGASAGNIQYFDLLIDDVVVTGRAANPVPEPGTLALLGLGLAGLGMSRRRKAD